MDVPPLAKRIVITGGRSRLAAGIRRHLTDRGAHVLSLSRSEGDSHLGLDNLFVGNLLDQSDTLLHLAWSTVPMSSERSVGLEWEQDIPLLHKILKSACASPHRERLHFVFFSSGGAVYGNAREGRPSRETDPCAPIGAYGRAKLAAEQIIENCGRTEGLQYTILRISNPYGFSAPTTQPQGLIPFIVKHAREGTTLPIWGDGTARKDFLHHSDFNAALAQVIARKPIGLFNVSSGRSHAVSEVLELTRAALSLPLKIQHLPAQPWDVHHSLIDNTKFRTTLDWTPVVPLSEGIRQTVAVLQAGR